MPRLGASSAGKVASQWGTVNFEQHFMLFLGVISDLATVLWPPATTQPWARRQSWTPRSHGHLVRRSQAIVLVAPVRPLLPACVAMPRGLAGVASSVCSNTEVDFVILRVKWALWNPLRTSHRTALAEVREGDLTHVVHETQRGNLGPIDQHEGVVLETLGLVHGGSFPGSMALAQHQACTSAPESQAQGPSARGHWHIQDPTLSTCFREWFLRDARHDGEVAGSCQPGWVSSNAPSESNRGTKLNFVSVHECVHGLEVCGRCRLRACMHACKQLHC